MSLTNFFSPHAPAWKAFFAKYAEQDRGWKAEEPKVAVEVGSYEGSSALWMLDNLLQHPDSKIYCIDMWTADDLLERFKANIGAHPGAKKVVGMRQRSWDALLRLNLQGVKADLVYIDGSHAAPDVLSDLVMAFNLTRLGGVIIADDYTWRDPTQGGKNILNRPKLAIDAFTTIYNDKLRYDIWAPTCQPILVKVSD